MASQVTENAGVSRELPTQGFRDLHELTADEFQQLAADGTNADKMRANILAGDAYMIRDALPRKALLRFRSYLTNVGRNSLPAYHAIAPGAPNHHRAIVNDPRSFVKGCFHQFSFFPWNQDVFDLFDLFRPIFRAKNILSNIPPDAFQGNTVDRGCTARISVQQYPCGMGHLGRHTDPVGYHQLVVPTLLMSDKKGHAGSQEGQSFDFSRGGAYMEREDGTRVCIDDLGGVGTLFFTNAKVIHGVEPIDPIEDYENAKASDIEWLDFKGRWMAGSFVNKVANNTSVAEASELTSKRPRTTA